MKKALILILFFTGITFAQNLPMKDKFYIGYHSFLYFSNYWQWDNYRNLGVNMMQIYRMEGWDEEPLRPPNYVKFIGGFYDALDGPNGYGPQVSQMITNWGSEIQPRSIYTEREKIIRGGYGQLSDYEAEMLNPSSYSPGYGWVTHSTGTNYSTDAYGASGWKCLKDVHTAESYMVKELYENCEQSDVIKQFPLTQTDSWPADYYYSDVKNSLWKWFVLPRMRINPSDANNTEKRVVRLEIYDFEGTLRDSVTLFANNFKPGGTGNYSGEYRDIFYKSNGDLIDLSILATLLNTDNTGSNWWESNVDYRVYWWGDADVWLDRVRVCDEWAFYLFNPELENPVNPQYDFDTKIKEEAQSSYIGTNSSFGYFYFDEFPYNRIPCLAKVNELIKGYNSNTGLVTEDNISLIANYGGIRNPLDYDDVFDKLYSSGVVKDVLFMYQYPFGQFKTYEATPGENSANDVYTYFPFRRVYHYPM